MQIKHVNEQFSVSDQLTIEDIATLRVAGVRTLICNRPDDEADKQINFQAIANRARQEGMEVIHLPVVHDLINAGDVDDFERAFAASSLPVHAYCRTGNRSFTLWSLMKVKQGSSPDAMIAKAPELGYDFSKFRTRFSREIENWQGPQGKAMPHRDDYDIVIVGGGSAGIAVAQSLLKRTNGLHIAVLEPSETHLYQPGFTMVGGGIFSPQQTRRPMSRVMPEKVTWIREAVVSFLPDENRVVLASNATVGYERLVVCPGLKLNWDGIEGLSETLGKNGVTSNYHPDLAAYTWKLVSEMRAGRAIFTQPPMPIKCAGAPQKAMYLAADHWLRNRLLDNINIDFYNAGGVLFGVKEYVPALQRYIERYGVKTQYSHNLKKIDGANRKAWFEHKDAEGNSSMIETGFDMIHVCPPQTAPDFIRASTLADEAGWVDVDQETLRHKRYANIWSLGDVASTPNAKTAAAVRKQVPVVAGNIVNEINGIDEELLYDGYGSCPLTVERGKIVLAEFGYGGKLLPTFPAWLLDGRKPTWLAWVLKANILPPFYWAGFLKAHEWLIKSARRKKQA